jgi:predicted ribosomally synthesized peptide with nif11-like leader
VAADHVDRLIEAIRGNPGLHQMMKAAVDVDDAVVMANQAGYWVTREDLLTMEARQALNQLALYGTLRRNSTSRYRERFD